MDKNIYTFRIEGYTPDTIPMSRLAEYMSVLADLVGYKNSTHFTGIEKGSVKIAHKIDDYDAPKVEARLKSVGSEGMSKDVEKAFSKLDDMLAEDNSTGQMFNSLGAVIIPFPGATRAKPIAFPIFRQEGSIDGQIVSIGGKDQTAHAQLQDGKITYTGFSIKRDLAKDLAKFLYGPKIRLKGNGKWERLSDGSWKLHEFQVTDYEVLDETSLIDTLKSIQSLYKTEVEGSTIYDDIMKIRSDDGEVH